MNERAVAFMRPEEARAVAMDAGFAEVPPEHLSSSTWRVVTSCRWERCSRRILELEGSALMWCGRHLARISKEHACRHLILIAERLVPDHKASAAPCCILMFESYAGSSEVLSSTTSRVTGPWKGSRGALAAMSLVIRARNPGVPSKTGLVDVSVSLDLPRHAPF